jgi:hypothetical protein
MKFDIPGRIKYALPHAELTLTAALNKPVVAKTVVVGTMLSLLPTLAQAGEDLASVSTRGQNQTYAVLKWIVYLFYAAGVVTMGLGVLKGIKKSKGDPQVQGGEIGGYLIGGAALGCIGVLANIMMNSLFGTSSDTAVRSGSE